MRQVKGGSTESGERHLGGSSEGMEGAFDSEAARKKSVTSTKQTSPEPVLKRADCPAGHNCQS